MLSNLLLMTDSYKVTHWRQYPPGTQQVYSYLEARAGGEYRETVFFGLQYFLKKYLAGPVVSVEKIEQADRFFRAHFGDASLFNRAGWEHILNQHAGRLPIEIRAVAEGTVVPESNVLMTIENTDPACFWLTNYLETLLVETWYPITTATISRQMKKIIKAALARSGTDTDANLDFKLHDFGYRGVSSPESAALGGAAHLLNFKGTDTLAACELLMEYYHAAMPGFSIPAAEHSTITSWGRENEQAAYRNMLEQFPRGLVAVVSDSWDIDHAVKKIWGEALRDQVNQRAGTLVIRPDSGEPAEVLPRILGELADRVGYQVNTKGYKVLNDQYRMIQGDGIRRDTLAGILDAVMAAGFSADNLAFGSGGGLLQDCDRDTQRMAMKCAQITINGVAHDVFKQPATDPKKNSKRGRLSLIRENGVFKTVATGSSTLDDLLVPVFRNGGLLVDQRLDEMRRRTATI